MASTTKSTINPLQALGSIVLFCASLALFFHRLPHREYAEVIADKPRPKAEKAPAAAPAAPAPIIVAAAAPPPKHPVHARPEPVLLASASLDAPPAPRRAVDLSDACRNEIGILCNHMSLARARRCLGKYTGVLLPDCRLALLGPDAEIESP